MPTSWKVQFVSTLLKVKSLQHMSCLLSQQCALSNFNYWLFQILALLLLCPCEIRSPSCLLDYRYLSCTLLSLLKRGRTILLIFLKDGWKYRGFGEINRNVSKQGYLFCLLIMWKSRCRHHQDDTNVSFVLIIKS